MTKNNFYENRNNEFPREITIIVISIHQEKSDDQRCLQMTSI